MNNSTDGFILNLTISGIDTFLLLLRSTFRIHFKSSVKHDITIYNQCNQVIKSDSKTGWSLEIVSGQVSVSEVSVPRGLTAFFNFDGFHRCFSVFVLRL